MKNRLFGKDIGVRVEWEWVEPRRSKRQRWHDPENDGIKFKGTPARHKDETALLKSKTELG